MSEYLFVVVFFGADQTQDEHRPCDLSHCPMSAEICRTEEEARAAMDAAPDWTQPHMLRVPASETASVTPTL